MLTQTESRTQVWERPTAKAKKGDIFRFPCQPIVRVIRCEQISATLVLFEVEPTNAEGSLFWKIETKPQPAGNGRKRAKLVTVG